MDWSMTGIGSWWRLVKAMARIKADRRGESTAGRKVRDRLLNQRSYLWFGLINVPSTVSFCFYISTKSDILVDNCSFLPDFAPKVVFWRLDFGFLHHIFCCFALYLLLFCIISSVIRRIWGGILIFWRVASIRLRRLRAICWSWLVLCRSDFNIPSRAHYFINNLVLLKRFFLVDCCLGRRFAIK